MKAVLKAKRAIALLLSAKNTMAAPGHRWPIDRTGGSQLLGDVLVIVVVLSFLFRAIVYVYSYVKRNV